MITANTNLKTEYGSFIINYHKTYFGDCISIIKGDITKGSIPLRIHSSCLFGEAFHACDCDCRQQLLKALEKINQIGYGVLIYLYQEGRGIGLENKIRSMNYQNQNNADTVEAFEHFDFPMDSRNYNSVLEALNDISISKHIRIMCNNPKKIKILLKNGYIIDEHINLEYTISKEAYQYLNTKFNKLGHKINFENLKLIE
jgi:3,4-dihydroxy 2-butanone 4-phosphate synthase/GTP cyclohydrolase II